jgi:hypothetical protein
MLFTVPCGDGVLQKKGETLIQEIPADGWGGGGGGAINWGFITITLVEPNGTNFK